MIGLRLQTCHGTQSLSQCFLNPQGGQIFQSQASSYIHLWYNAKRRKNISCKKILLIILKVSNSPTFFTSKGESEESILLFLGLWGSNFFLGVLLGFEETKFSWFCLYERQKGCKSFRWRLNLIIGSAKLIQWKGCLDYFSKSITEYYRIKHSKVFLNWKVGQFYCKISLILLLGNPGKGCWGWGILGRPYFDLPGLRN